MMSQSHMSLKCGSKTSCSGLGGGTRDSNTAQAGPSRNALHKAQRSPDDDVELWKLRRVDRTGMQDEHR